MIDPRLQTLRVLREKGTVTATAEALHLTPSTVSQQLRRLSAQLGVALLEPVGRRVRLTTAAVTLLGHADALNALWERAAADLAAHRDGEAGQLRISGVATALAAVIAPAAEKLRRRHPQLTLHLTEDAGENRFELLLARQTDIAVVIPTPTGPPPDDPRFEQRPLLEEPQDLLVPAGHPFADRDGVELAEAASETWIRAGDPHDQHQLLLTTCAAAGFTPRVAHNAVDWSAIASLVAHGFGVCLVPRLAPVPQHYSVTRVRLRGEPAPARRLIACVRRGSDRQAPVARGLAALQEAAAQWAARGRLPLGNVGPDPVGTADMPDPGLSGQGPLTSAGDRR
ncbi:LysR family transcriptional regulator [Streptomyces sp. H27-D2]|uniref:LysR family transcriptional regulator n=1 Tax=Streptomyces sp. H27-D2 TaxID=3046304 RepID=UPI002DB5F715|nr:LysR family transcriptional regulator [Streptomyces sp. H27-D2]MEC4014748.1 LysR family transcriptional regulator [Streptomyces sp. H27-D2]